jgi:hypothetical protein
LCGGVGAPLANNPLMAAIRNLHGNSALKQCAGLLKAYSFKAGCGCISISKTHPKDFKIQVFIAFKREFPSKNTNKLTIHE